MQRHIRNNPRLRVITLAAALMVGLWQGVAFAQVSGPEAPSVDNPPAPDADAPEAPSAPDEAPEPSAPSGGSTSSSQAPAAPQASSAQPTEDDDLPGHETEDPRRQTHASGEVAEINLTETEAVAIGRTNSEINEDYSSSSDATVLALGGETVIGSEADSGGETEGSVAPIVVCEESEGQVCLGLLFANSSATEDDDSSQSSADVGLAFTCVGGDNPDATGPEDCGSAPVTAGVSEAHSSTTADKSDGSQTADQETSLADVCLGPEGQVAGVCSGIGIEAMQSESSSSIEDENNNGTTTDDQGETSRSSRVVVLQAGGEEPIAITDPTAIAVPPDCPTDPGSIVCLFLNQGESFVEDSGFAGSRQEAVHIALLVADALPGGAVLSGHLGTAESAVLGMDAECPPGYVFDPETGECLFECPNGELVANPEDCPDGGPRDKCPDGTVVPRNEDPDDFCPGGGGDITPRGGLAVTGAGLLPLVAVSLVLAAGGLGAITTERRRRKP